MSGRAKRTCAAMLLIVLAVGLGATVTGVGQSASDADRARADALYQEGEAAYSAAQSSQAIVTLERALALYRAIGDRGSEAGSLSHLGSCFLGDHPRVVDYCIWI